MARPIKNNADYFSHDIGMRNDMKIKALRRKYGIIGYGVYVMMLEIIAGSDAFEFTIAEDDVIAWEMLAGDMDIETIDLKEIINYMSQLGLILYQEGKIWSNGLKKRLSTITEKRELMRHKRKQTNVCDTQIQESVSLCDTNSICDTQSTQSKVKESTVKESNIYPKGYSESEDSQLPEILENKDEGQVQSSHEDPTITLILDFLKKEIGIGDFREDKKTQRAQARNIRDLKEKLGDHEFKRRLEDLKCDKIKFMNCNSITYFYGELKSARIKPMPPTPTASTTGEGKGISSLPTPKPTFLDDTIPERDPEVSARIKAELDAKVSKLKRTSPTRPNILMAQHA